MNYLEKGRFVAVSGSIRTSRSRDDSVNMNYYTDVNAFKVEFLEWGNNNSDDFSSTNDDDVITF